MAKRETRSWKRLALFGVLFVAFQAFFVLVIEESAWFRWYLETNAATSAAVLRCLGFGVTSTGAQVIGEGTTVQIKLGCDGLQPIALFCIATALLPRPGRIRLLGATLGALALLLLNQGRIASLWFLAWKAPDHMQAAHEDVWPLVFILVALTLLLLVARGNPSPKPETS